MEFSAQWQAESSQGIPLQNTAAIHRFTLNQPLGRHRPHLSVQNFTHALIQVFFTTKHTKDRILLFSEYIERFRIITSFSHVCTLCIYREFFPDLYHPTFLCISWFKNPVPSDKRIHLRLRLHQFGFNLLDFFLSCGNIDFRLRFESVHIAWDIQVEFVFLYFL